MIGTGFCLAQLHGSLGCQTGDPGISHSSAKRCKQKKKKTTLHDAKGKRKTKNKISGPQKNHDQTTVEGNTVDFSSFWWIQGLEHPEV